MSTGALLLLVMAFAPAKVHGNEVLLPVLDGGDFGAGVDPVLGLVPWWRTTAGAPRVEDGALVLDGGARVAQPFAVAVGTPFAVFGEVTGSGRLVVVDGEGGQAAFDVGGDGGPHAFRFDSDGIAERIGRAPIPRFTMHVAAASGTVRWHSIAVHARVAVPPAEELRMQIVERIDALVTPWLERGLDRTGSRHTALLTRFFDADTGLPTGAPMRRMSFDPLHDRLLEAWRLEPRESWRVALEAHLSDFFELCLHPGTGLPRHWDPVEDRPADDEPLEIAAHLRFLLDVANHGPEATRARALEAATRIGEMVLARGVLSTGVIAPKYRPGDARPFTDVVPLRRLDVPAQLARLGARLGDRRFADAAREAVRELEYAHHWPGTWDRIDPGFDDDFGHYGERAVTMWEAWPDEPAFHDLALSGWRKYEPLWRDAVRHGGNVAADQVRCWRIARRLARLSPELAPVVRERLDEAARLHFKGGQGNDGTWVDVTIFGFDPQRLPVGDTAGVPHNLLEGLAVVHGAGLGLDGGEMAARYLEVLGTTDRVFGGRFGHVAGARREVGEGAENPALGSVRLLTALVDMLEALTPSAGARAE